MADQKLGNPAVVGLAGFGGTTLLLQFHNLGLAGVGVVLCTALFFGGLAQLCAGLKEYGNGNNFGFAAFTTYGAFWMSLAAIWLVSSLGIFEVTTSDVGWFLVAFTVPTIIYTLAACRASGAHSLLFVTLLLGFIFLDLGHLGGGAMWNIVAAVDLILCGFTALYIMASIVLVDFGWKLPLGKGWLAK
ncbi:MAG: acetate uptake transporter [Dehalococcoidia bacterium]|nr:acetate uptake transporter [Dehalococcoidia bacterium]